jgi:thioesterase domain-containing protein
MLCLEDMAAPLTALIQSQLLSPPYVLVGYSFAGILAFEVAHQLQRNGIRVDAIVLLDTWRTGPSFWQKLRVMSFSRARQFLRKRARKLLGTVSESSAVPQSIEQGDELGPSDVPEEIRDSIIRSIDKQLSRQPLHSHGVVVRSRDDGERARFYGSGWALGWDGLFTNGLYISDAPGDHGSMLAPENIRHLAQSLKEVLAPLISKC